MSTPRPLGRRPPIRPARQRRQHVYPDAGEGIDGRRPSRHPPPPMSPPLRIWTADRILVCVPADLPEDRVEALRTLLDQAPSIDGVLELLTADGLAATPSFVC